MQPATTPYDRCDAALPNKIFLTTLPIAFIMETVPAPAGKDFVFFGKLAHRRRITGWLIARLAGWPGPEVETYTVYLPVILREQ